MKKVKSVVFKAADKARRQERFDSFKKRLFYIFGQLQSRGWVRTGELAEVFNVSSRTVQRDLESLRQDQVIRADELEQGRWLFNGETQSFLKMNVTDHDAATLAFIYKLSKIFGGEVNKSVLQSIDKLFLLDETSYPFFMITPRVKNPDMTLPFYKDLYRAIQEKLMMNLTYRKAGGPATVKGAPFALIMSEGLWYLGYLPGENGKFKDIRTVRYSNIVSVEPLEDETYEKPEWVKDALRNARNIWFGTQAPVKVTLEADNIVRDYFEACDYFPQQKIGRKGPSTFSIECRISHPNEALPNILRFLPYIRVVSPPDLKAAALERVKSYLKK
jgi:predicted DNA-binding transcriptional regulator YafY